MEKKSASRANCRDFDHHANRRIRVKSLSFLGKLFFCLCNIFLCTAQFLQGRDHREHDLHFAKGGSPQKCPQLREEQFRPIQTNADCAIA